MQMEPKSEDLKWNEQRLTCLSCMKSIYCKKGSRFYQAIKESGLCLSCQNRTSDSKYLGSTEQGGSESDIKSSKPAIPHKGLDKLEVTEKCKSWSKSESVQKATVPGRYDPGSTISRNSQKSVHEGGNKGIRTFDTSVENEKRSSTNKFRKCSICMRDVSVLFRKDGSTTCIYRASEDGVCLSCRNRIPKVEQDPDTEIVWSENTYEPMECIPRKRGETFTRHVYRVKPQHSIPVEKTKSQQTETFIYRHTNCHRPTKPRKREVKPVSAVSKKSKMAVPRGVTPLIYITYTQPEAGVYSSGVHLEAAEGTRKQWSGEMAMSSEEDSRQDNYLPYTRYKIQICTNNASSSEGSVSTPPGENTVYSSNDQSRITSFNRFPLYIPHQQFTSNTSVLGETVSSLPVKQSVSSLPAAASTSPSVNTQGPMVVNVKQDAEGNHYLFADNQVYVVNSNKAVLDSSNLNDSCLNAETENLGDNTGPKVLDLPDNSCVTPESADMVDGTRLPDPRTESAKDAEDIGPNVDFSNDFSVKVKDLVDSTGLVEKPRGESAADVEYICSTVPGDSRVQVHTVDLTDTVHSVPTVALPNDPRVKVDRVDLTDTEINGPTVVLPNGLGVDVETLHQVGNTCTGQAEAQTELVMATEYIGPTVSFSNSSCVESKTREDNRGLVASRTESAVQIEYIDCHINTKNVHNGIPCQEPHVLVENEFVVSHD